MISVSGKYWEEVSVNKRLVDKVKIDMILPANFPDSFVLVPTTNFE